MTEELNYKKLIETGVELAENNELSKARTVFEALEAVNEDNYYIHLNIGQIYLLQGYAEKAYGHLLKASAFPEADATANALLQHAQKLLGIVKEEKKTPLKILFLQPSPCIRNYKIAKALRQKGHLVSLAYFDKKLSEVYGGLSDSIYSSCHKIENYMTLWELAAGYDLIHSHNEPDQHTVTALGAKKPVVHDTHDLMSLRSPGSNNIYWEGLANRTASARVYTTSYQLQEARTMYNVPEPNLVLHNYISFSDRPKVFLPKLSLQDNAPHIVYEGGFGGRATHRQFADIFFDLAKYGVHSHIYPVRYDPEVEAMFKDNPYLHYEKPVSPTEIMTQMTQYDFGIIPWHLTQENQRFLDSTIANKFFEYLAAGLPVYTSPVRSYKDYFKEHRVGTIFNNAAEIVDNLEMMATLAAAGNLKSQALSFEDNIDKLTDLYFQILN